MEEYDEQNRSALVLIFTAAALLALGGAPRAWAAANLTETRLVADETGFPGVCAVPCFVVEKKAEVWFPDNTGPDSGNPGVCESGEYTYVYTLTQLGSPPSTFPPPGIPVTEFEVSVKFSLIASAGHIGDGGITPTSTTPSPLNVVSWAFPPATSCPDCLDQGQTSGPALHLLDRRAGHGAGPARRRLGHRDRPRRSGRVHRPEAGGR